MKVTFFSSGKLICSSWRSFHLSSWKATTKNGLAKSSLVPKITYGVKIYNPRMQELLIGASWEVDRWAMVVLVFFDDRAKSAEDMSLAK